MAGKSKKADALARLRDHLTRAETSDVSLDDTVLIGVARVGRTTFYDYVKKTPGLQAEIDAAKAEQAKFLADTPSGRNRRKVQERIAKLEGRIAALEAANLALLAEQAAFVDALRGPACRVAADKVQKAQSIALAEADRTLSGAGRRESPRVPFHSLRQ